MPGQGSTRVADILTPAVWVPYVEERTVYTSRLVRSGIVVPDPKLNILAQAGGKLINMPFFTDLAGDDEVLGTGTGATNSSLTPDNMSTSKDIAVLHMRGKAWGVEDIAAALAGADPMKALGNMVADFWNRKEQALLIATLTGVFKDNSLNDSSSLIKDISTGDGGTAATSNLINGDAVIDAMTKLGDMGNQLTAMCMHSVPFSRLQKNNLIDYVEHSEAKIKIPYYMGKEVIVDDTCPSTAGTNSTRYTTYLFGPGAVGRGEGAAPTPVETDRNSLAGLDLLVHRRHFLLHPRGIAFQSASVAGQSPTNTECTAASNWDRVYQTKNIRLVSIVTNG
ncbi:MAG: major capsid protein [Planctomycetota bacterium]